MKNILKFCQLGLITTILTHSIQVRADDSFQATGYSHYYCGAFNNPTADPEAKRDAVKNAISNCQKKGYESVKRASLWSMSTDYRGFCGTGYGREGMIASRATATFVCQE